jgi:ribonuclease HI
MDKRKGNVTLSWVPSGHAGITGNEEADEEKKRALEESISKNEKYPPKDLSGWMKTEMADSRQRKRGGECIHSLFHYNEREKEKHGLAK